MPGLRCSKNCTAAPDLKVTHGNLEARPQIGVFHQNLKTLLCIFSKRCLFRNKKVCVSLLITTPVLMYLIWLRRWTFMARAALLSSGLILLPALLYANTGFAQYGYRYAADFLPFLILAMALAGLRIHSRLTKTLIIAGVIVCLWGAFLAGWYPFSLEQFQVVDDYTLLRYR